MIIKKHSGIYSFTVKQELPIDLEMAWDFFSNPSNLEKITPKEMKFLITSGSPNNMFEGQIISYKVGILPKIKTNWVTEITHIKHLDYFIDEQRFGPYKMWHHQHIFKKKDNGIIMSDIVHFKLPFGFLGDLAYHIFIKKQLYKIFNYRKESLSQHFSLDI